MRAGFRSAALGGGRSSRRAEQLSTLLGDTTASSPLTLSTEDLSVRSASPRYHSTWLDEDK